MSNPKSGERRIPHNWTKETLGECATTHMEQLMNAYFNHVPGCQRDRSIKNIIESYHRMEVSVLNGDNFTTVPEPHEKDEPDEIMSYQIELVESL